MFILFLDFTRRIRKNFTLCLISEIKKKHEQFEGGGEKERVAEGYEGARKKGPEQFEGYREKKSARRRWLVSFSGTLLMLDDEVVDKLFGF